MRLITASQSRELDRAAMDHGGIPAVDLMDRAARGLCAAVMELLPKGRRGGGRAAVFCGAGNNGGDGIGAARLLFLEGVRVRAFLVGRMERMPPESREETRRLSECGVALEPFDPDDPEQRAWTFGSDVLVDALCGVGLSRSVAPDTPTGAAVLLMNRAPGRVVSADIPTGVAADTGEAPGLAVKADKTVAFTLAKVGSFVGPGRLLSGAVRVCDIGIPPRLLQTVVCPTQTLGEDFVWWALPPRKPGGHKGDFGKVLVVGGCVGYTGAPCLTALAATRSGCGLVYLGVPESIWAVEADRCGTAMPFPLPERKGMLSEKALQQILERLESCDILALGPGLGRSEGVDRVVLELLARTEKPVVLDADGINALAAHIDILDHRRGRVTILTPHDGEFARLNGGETRGGRLEQARSFAIVHGCVLVLKGHDTLVASPSGNVLMNGTGNNGLAKGGSGDVLTGVIASLLAQGATPMQAAGMGVWLHGKAGDLAAERLTEYGMTPEDVLTALPAAFASVLKKV